MIATFFTDTSRLAFRDLTAADIHPVALNILNTKRAGQFLIPSPTGSQPVLNGNGTYGREYLQQQVIPTEVDGRSGFGSLELRSGGSNRTRMTLTRSAQDVREAFGWADASPSPTLGRTVRESLACRSVCATG